MRAPTAHNITHTSPMRANGRHLSAANDDTARDERNAALPCSCGTCHDCRNAAMRAMWEREVAGPEGGAA